MFEPFAPGDYVLIAIPTEPIDAKEFVELYQRIAVTVGDLSIRLADHPRMFSSTPDEQDLFRGVPTFVPVSVFPDGYLGSVQPVSVRAHRR